VIAHGLAFEAGDDRLHDLHRRAGRRDVDPDRLEPVGSEAAGEEAQAVLRIGDRGRSGVGQGGEGDAAALGEDGGGEAAAELGRVLGDPLGHRFEGAVLLLLDHGDGDLLFHVFVRHHLARIGDRAVRGGLAGAGAAELQQRLAERAGAVRVRGFAAGGDLDGGARLARVVADDVEVGQAEIGAGELDGDADAKGAQAVEEGGDSGLLVGVEIHHGALVEGAVGDDVAVALEQLHQPVGDGVRQVEAGAEAVGDRRDEARWLAELVGVGGDPFARHQHRLVRRPAAAFDPGERRLRRVGAAGGEAERQRVEEGALAAGADEFGVARHHARRPRQPLADMHLLAELAEGADLGLYLGEAVAVAGGGGLAGEDEVRLHHGDADAVEAVDAEVGHLGAGGHGGAEGVGHRLEVGGAQAEALSRKVCMGMCRTPGGPLTASSSTARAIFVVMPGACSKGVQTVSKSSGAMTLR
jgi:hypothetical protein